MIDQERQKHSNQDPGVNKNMNISQADILSKPKRRKRGTRVIEGAIATTIALLAPLQAATVYEKISSTEKNTGIMASAGIHYSSIARQVTHEPASPSLATINTSPQPGVPPAVEPKQVESPNCIDGWEALSEGVCFTKLREFGSDVYAVRVDLKNPKVSVRPSFVAGPGRLGRLRDSAESQDAIAAINLSFITADGHPVGPIFVDGNWIHTDPSPQQVLMVNKDNTSGILPTKQALAKDPSQMKFALSGSHVLVRNGIATADFGPDNAGDVLKGRHPRSTIGENARGELYMVVVDGRSSKSRGVTMAELALVMAKLGMHNAVALDGGGSTRLYIKGDDKKGEIRNNPSNKSRKISTGVFVTAGR